MMNFVSLSAIILVVTGSVSHAFQASSTNVMRTTTQLDMDRRQFGASSLGWVATAAAGITAAGTTTGSSTSC